MCAGNRIYIYIYIYIYVCVYIYIYFWAGWPKLNISNILAKLPYIIWVYFRIICGYFSGYLEMKYFLFSSPRPKNKTLTVCYIGRSLSILIYQNEDMMVRMALLHYAWRNVDYIFYMFTCRIYDKFIQSDELIKHSWWLTEPFSSRRPSDN